MSKSQILSIFTSAVYTAFKISAPVLLVSIAAGLIVSVFQSVTQIHEQSLTFVPKIIAVAVVFLTLGTWMVSVCVEFFSGIFTAIASL
ncbi:MAG: flagellar biosynthetic protein FliQ [Oscillospiraceae bacterium]|nr:flagellar biosynthetic protein FliQ [Oscillospiraceae bacterium]